ncbi:MAG: hypothetical protein OXQ90_20185 [Gammaproteobacteria bacterium]|nr:hypothetical protein [Gammaproteobacteria bacterium]
MLDLGPGTAAVAAALITGTVTLVASLVVARMSIKAARSNQIQDGKKQSYTAVLMHLNEATRAADIVDYGYNSGEPGGSEAYHESNQRPDHEKSAHAAWTKCRSAFYANQLVLSRQFRNRFSLLLENLPTVYDDLFPWEHASKRASSLRSAYDDLLDLAIAELDDAERPA